MALKKKSNSERHHAQMSGLADKHSYAGPVPEASSPLLDSTCGSTQIFGLQSMPLLGQKGLKMFQTAALGQVQLFPQVPSDLALTKTRLCYPSLFPVQPLLL